VRAERRDAGGEVAHSTNGNLTRREFFEAGAAAGAGLVLAFYLPIGPGTGAPAPGEPFAPNAFLEIERDGTVTISVIRSEMGQGVLTTMPMLVAEELEADWSTVRIKQALANPVYGREQSTNASRSTRESWNTLRKAGATAREMLITAAAQAWGVEQATCHARNGAVIHATTGRRLTYGELSAAAARLPVPQDVPLKDPKDPAAFRILGRRIRRLDIAEKVDGSARFGIDVRIPGMLYATVTRCPVFGGKVSRFDGTQSKAVPGVRDVVQIEGGVAIVATSTWSTMQARNLLRVVWDEGPFARLTSADIARTLAELVERSGVTGRHEGDAPAALASAAQTLEAVYEVPYQAHACLEPMTCTADVRPDRCELWAPTQAPRNAQEIGAQITGLPLERVIVHTTLLGGGFGRKQMRDYIADAVELSKAMAAPVQVVWSREDDLQHDYYRPASYHKLRAGLDASGRLVAWMHRVVGESTLGQNWKAAVAAGRPWSGVDAAQVQQWIPEEAMDGAANLQYAIPNLHVDYVRAEIGVPVGWWRSVYNSQNAFANESFLDEVAAATGRDAYGFRRVLLEHSPRLRGVLELAATKAEWGTRLPEGRYRGIACHPYLSCDTFVAQVAEVSVAPTGLVRVHRVVCAVDCGFVLNPAVVEAQMESAIVYGLTAAMKGAITIDAGRVLQHNFDDYPMLRMHEMPIVEVHIVPSDEPPGGAGEAGVPPIAPAVCNAIFAATGKRLRRLPIGQLAS